MAYEDVLTLECSKSVTCGGAEGQVPSVEGYYLGSKKIQSEISQSGFTFLHVFVTPDGNIGVWGKAALDTLIQSVTPGNMTLINFTGMRAASKKGRKPSYTYNVKQDKTNKIDVGNLSNSSPTSDADMEGSDDSELFEEPVMDQVVAAPVKRPSAPLTTPSASSQAATRALLGGKRQH